MEWEQVKQYLEAHKDSEDVRGFLRELVGPPSLDDVKRAVEENDEVKNWLQSEKDRHFSKGLETWKQKTLPGILDEEREKIRKELNPEETPEQKELRELREKFERAERERRRESLRNKAYKQATEKGLPVDLLDFLVTDDEETTQANLAKLEEVWTAEKQRLVEQQFKQHGRTPHPPAPDASKNNLKMQYEKALKEGNTTQAIAIKRKMAFQQQE